MLKYLFLLSVAAGSFPAAAQDADEEIVIADRRAADDRITVTATGLATDSANTGQSVTVIGQDEIARIQGADIARVLTRAPSVVFTRNGPLGSFTGVSVRGAASEQLLVLIDGVRVADQASPSGGFDFGTLLATNVASLDLLRGAETDKIAGLNLNMGRFRSIAVIIVKPDSVASCCEIFTIDHVVMFGPV